MEGWGMEFLFLTRSEQWVVFVPVSDFPGR
jgi:hypothetical protein